jgi:hypothetical protein
MDEYRRKAKTNTRREDNIDQVSQVGWFPDANMPEKPEVKNYEEHKPYSNCWGHF